MKKLFFLILTLSVFTVSAQSKFHPGIRAGVNFAKFTSGQGSTFPYDENRRNFSNLEYIQDFYVGFQSNIRFTNKYALQPELTYSRQGSKATLDSYDNNGNTVRGTYKMNVSYLSLAVINKLYLADKFYFQAGPFLDIQVESKLIHDNEIPFDLGIIGGLGMDITKNIGVEARVKKGIVGVIDNYDINGTNLVFSVGGTFTFF